MASINGLGGSSGLSSIYGNRNVLSGLASGMDTESMIENAVSGIKMKITGLTQKRTKTEWQQQALRSIIDKMANFSQKYASYTSSSNLLSGSFFNNAVKATAGGTNSKYVSAVGKTSSDVQILGVKQLASKATWKSQAAGVDGTIKGSGEAIDLNADVNISSISGSMTLTVGSNTNVKLNFSKDKIYTDKNDLLTDIKKQLEGTKITADFNADGNIEFKSGDNMIKITAASGDFKDKMGIDLEANPDTTTLAVNGMTGADFTKTDGKVGDALYEKEFSFTLDGVTKKIKLSDYTDKPTNGDEFTNKLQSALDQEFGSGKIAVENLDTNGKLSLSFDAVQDGSTLAISGGKAMGLASDYETSYMNPSKTLESMLGKAYFENSANRIAASGNVTAVTDAEGNTTHYVDEAGNRVKADPDTGSYYRVDDKDEFQYDFKVNGKSAGLFTKDSTMESVMTAINNNAEIGVNVSYSQTTNKFQFVSTQSGEMGKIQFEKGGLSAALFGEADAKGTDAQFTMKVNGDIMNVTRNDNTFDVDGLKVTLKDTFSDYAEKTDANGDGKTDPFELVNQTQAEKDAATFTFGADTDKIIGVIKDMVKDYNEMMGEIKDAYTTLPGQKSNGSPYEPLTDKDMEDMSESAIKAYEEKAKQGLLFGDRDLAGLYEGLRDAITPNGKDSSILRSIGIDVAYSEGRTTLVLDENKLKAALENDPDKVKDAFTKKAGNGSATDGLMQSMKNTLDKYGKLSSGDKGVLVKRAGSPKLTASLYDNTIQKSLDNYNRQIDRLTDRMTDQVDMYTRKFSQLEQLIAQMNSQSSSLMGLMGG